MPARRKAVWCWGISSGDPDDDYLFALAALESPPVPVLTPAELLSRLHGS